MDDKKRNEAIQPAGRDVAQARRLARRGRRHLERTKRATEDLRLGLSALYDKRYDEAQRRFSNVLKVDPDRAEAHYYIGLTQFMLGEYEAAVASYSGAIENGYADPDVIQSLGDSLMMLERYEQAVEAYETALSRRASAEGYARMGQALTTLGKRSEAVEAFKQALKLKLSTVATLYDLPEEDAAVEDPNG